MHFFLSKVSLAHRVTVFASYFDCSVNKLS